MVPPKNAFLSLRLPIFGSSYYQCFYTFGIAPIIVIAIVIVIIEEEKQAEKDAQQRKVVTNE